MADKETRLFVYQKTGNNDEIQISGFKIEDVEFFNCIPNTENGTLQLQLTIKGINSVVRVNDQSAIERFFLNHATVSYDSISKFFAYAKSLHKPEEKPSE